jgi:hypothetical protein
MSAWLLWAALGVAAADAEVPVALVAVVRGEVKRERGKKVTAADYGDLVLAGDRFTVGMDDVVVLVFLADGHRERLKAGSSATAGEKGCTPAEAVEVVEGSRPPTKEQLRLLYEHARAVQAVGGRAAVGVLRGPAAVGVLRGSSEAPLLPVRPLWGSRVLTDHPTLNWQPVMGADSYQVVLLEGPEGRDERTLWKVVTKQTTLPYPEEEKVLEMGLRYRWRVSARQGEQEKVVLEGRFFTARKEVREELARLRPLVASDDPADWLVAALAYEAAGVYDRALALYEKLAEKAPKAANYQLALAAYYERAGQRDQAAAARKKAEELRTKAGK